MMKKLFNPVAHFDEKVLLGAGLASVIIAIVFGYLFGFKLDALFHITYAKKDWSEVGITTLRSYGVAVAAFFLLGLLINKRARFIDILNTVLIANVPLVALSLLQKLPFISNALDAVLRNPKGLDPLTISALMLISLIVFPLTVLCFVLLYNGFRTSVNMKEWYHITLFVMVAIFVNFTQFI
ncbi:hypothetical protein [Leadbetterella sp. DM7]|uniref:hypothetical protein n=1 Tax=Leadbetterella sp. DM7 TaxID=3235085 RepID=UPI00349E85E9